MARYGLLLCDDLMLGSKITATARAHGLDVRTCRTPADLLAKAGADVPACVLLDLHHPALEVQSVVAALKALDTPPVVVGFGSHVATQLLQAAAEAGCDVVWPKSKMASELETSLPRWLGEQP